MLETFAVGQAVATNQTAILMASPLSYAAVVRVLSSGTPPGIAAGAEIAASVKANGCRWTPVEVVASGERGVVPVFVLTEHAA